MRTRTRHTRRYLIGPTAIFCIAISTVSWAWDPVKQLTGRRFDQIVNGRLQNLGNEANKFLKKPIDYLMNLPGGVLADACSAPVHYYENTLEGQAQSRWQQLPSDFIQAAQYAYSVDLTAIRYAEDVHTSNGDAQTFGNRIYFPRSINFYDRDDLHWILHELEHTVQYADSSGGQATKLCEYVAKAVGAGFKHDGIDMERAADRKADWAINTVYAAMMSAKNGGPGLPVLQNQILITNDTDDPVTFYIETAQYANTPATLPPQSWSLFSGGPSDTWFNVSIGTQTPDGHAKWIKYGLDAGSRQHINYNEDGVLDMLSELQ